MYPYPNILAAVEAAANLRKMTRQGRLEQNSASDLWILQGFAQYWLFGNPRYSGPVAVGSIDDVERALDGLTLIADRTSSFPEERLAQFASPDTQIDWQRLAAWCASKSLELLVDAPGLGAILESG
jgi:hypothetical protein